MSVEPPIARASGHPDSHASTSDDQPSGTLSAGKYWGLRRLADSGGVFRMTAVDQRPPIKNLIRARRGLTEAPWDDVARFKELLIRELQCESSAMLLDPHYAYPRGVTMLDPRIGMILTLEDSLFRETPEGRLSSEIDDWSVEKIKRAGGDAVKVLAWYRPDGPARVRDAQREFVRRIGAACRRFDLPFVFELLLYPLPGEDAQTREYVEMQAKQPQRVVDSVHDFAAAEFGVDLFKLESPVPAAQIADPDGAEAASTQAWFDAVGAAAGRPWVMLSAGAGMPEFRRVLTYAYRAGASGYLAGRAIWMRAFEQFPDWDRIAHALRAEGLPYMRDLNAMTGRDATPWHRHPVYGPQGPRVEPADASFRQVYTGFGA
jgi:tagatose 1,6-diphosphate aldolase